MNSKLIVLYNALCSMLLWTSIACATTYYVDSSQTGYNGSSAPSGACATADSGAGTSSSSPWCTIQKVQAKIGSALAGDSFLFKRGDTWNEMLTMPQGVNGTSASPITLSNYSTGNLPLIDGQNTLAQFIFARGTGGASSLWSYITVDGFEVKNMTSMGIEFYQNAGGTSAMPGIVIQNCSVHNTGPATDVGATNCSTGYCNQIFVLDENLQADGTKFIGNTAYACGGHNCYQLQNDLGSPLVDGNTCNGPWIHNCLDLKNAVGAIVQNNRCNGGAGGGTSGACYYFESSKAVNADITWRYNTAANSNGFTAAAAYSITNSVTAHIYQNTVHTSPPFSAVTTGASCLSQPLILDIHDNQFYGSVGTMYWPLSCAQWSLSTWDYNRIRTLGAYVQYQGTNYDTLPAWQATGFGLHDIWDP